MTFLQYWILLLIPLAIVPTILYWLRRRWTQQTHWAAMDFLLQAYRQTSSKRKRSELLQLILQTVLVTLVIFVVAQPVFYVTNTKIVVKKPKDSKTEFQSVYTISDNDSKAKLYLQSGLKQICSTARFEHDSIDNANPQSAQNCNILILHGLNNVPQWLTTVIETRTTQNKPVWIFAPHRLNSVSRERLKNVLPPMAKEPSKDTQLFVTLNTNSDLWQNSTFQSILGTPIPFPSQVNTVYESINGWQPAFENSSAVLVRKSIVVFSSAVDGNESSWGLTDFWIPLLDRVADVSINIPNSSQQTQYVPGNPWLSSVLAGVSLFILLWLFVRFHRRNQYGLLQKIINWTCFILAEVILIIMTIHATFTPIVRVKPVIAFVVDDSQSMTLPQSADGTQTRIEALIQWLDNHTDELKVLQKHYTFFESTFSKPDSVTVIHNIDRWRDSLLHRPYTCQKSDVNYAVHKSLESLEKIVDSKTIQAVFILSDGTQTNIETENDLKYSVKPRLYAVALGDEKPIPNVAIENVKLDEILFAGHNSQIEFQIKADSLQGQSITVELTQMEFNDEGKALSDSVVIGTQTIKITSPNFVTEGNFDLTPPSVGKYKYTLNIKNRSDEFIQADNTVSRLAVVEDRQIQILLVSSNPNWEFRYLRNLLARTKTFNLSVVLQNASKEYVTEDSCALSAFPDTFETLNKYDVLIFITPRFDWLNQDSKSALTQFIHQNEPESTDAHTIHKSIIGFWNQKTDFNSIAMIDSRWLPFDVTAVDTKKEIVDCPAILTPLGQTTGWLKLSSASSTLWQSFPKLGRVVSVRELKPNVKTLLETGENKSPLLTVHTIGSIRIATLLTDSFWRLRKGDGEQYYNRFQQNLIRAMVKRNSDDAVTKDDSFNSPVPLEWLNTKADISALNNLVTSTNGFVMRPDDNRSIYEAVPVTIKPVYVRRPPIELWNQPWLLTILLSLLFTDWTLFYLYKK